MKEEKNNDQLQMLKEMIESMYESTKNIEDIVSQQSTLIDIIENSNEKRFFEKFVEDLKTQMKQYNENKSKLFERIGYLEFACKTVESNEKDKKIVEAILLGLGVFNS